MADAKIPERTAIILYGTETGNAQDLAEELGRLTQRLLFETTVAELDSVSASVLSQHTICVFVLSTTGQGDFPSNARSFWTSVLKKRLTSDFLHDVNYALVGLGDTSYPKFNWAARKLGKRLTQLGATEILPDCEADEQGDEGLYGAYLAWSSQFHSVLLDQYPITNGRQPIPNDGDLPSKWSLRISADHPTAYEDCLNLVPSFPTLLPDYDCRPIPGCMTATLRCNSRVTPACHWQDVRFLSLTVEDFVDYMPGDALAVLPKNFTDDVNALLRRMRWTEFADLPIEFAPTLSSADLSKYPPPPISHPLPYPKLTLHTLLSEHLDITAIPRRSFFSAISRFTENPMHKERLLEFTDPQYLDEYYDYTTRPRRSILEILQEFDSVMIPWQEVANVIPVLRPRQFSIASGGTLKRSSEGSTNFDLLVAIVKYRTVMKKVREGVCTRYIAALPPGSTLNIVLRKDGRFCKSKEANATSHLLIGAGTGIAPLRSLIYEKTFLASASEIVSPTFLVFGSRSTNSDFFFGETFMSMAAKGSTGTSNHDFQIVTAFSRDQKEKIYVQDRLRERAGTVFDFLFNQGATVVVCGSSGQMPKSVRQALLEILASEGSNSCLPHAPTNEEEASRFLDMMEKKGLYKQETW